MGSRAATAEPRDGRSTLAENEPLLSLTISSKPAYGVGADAKRQPDQAAAPAQQKRSSLLL
jgi:hypothetical protein